MAKSKKSGVKKTANSTTRRAAKNKPKSDRASGVTRTGDGFPSGCDFCGDAASGTVFYCEDGVMTPLPPPTVASYLRIDPAGSGLPHWEPE
jgi:hypothetical protein